MKETKRFEFSKGSVRKFRFEVAAVLEGTDDDYREFRCAFQFCPTKAGYLNLDLCLWIPFVDLNLYWGWDLSDSPESENKL